jgi:hypothetical protein
MRKELVVLVIITMALVGMAGAADDQSIKVTETASGPSIASNSAETFQQDLGAAFTPVTMTSTVGQTAIGGTPSNTLSESQVHMGLTVTQKESGNQLALGTNGASDSANFNQQTENLIGARQVVTSSAVASTINNMAQNTVTVKQLDITNKCTSNVQTACLNDIAKSVKQCGVNTVTTEQDITHKLVTVKMVDP